MKNLAKHIFKRCGLQISRSRSDAPPATAGRPVGSLPHFFEDLVARGFTPRGILDIGANSGRWARSILKVFPDAALVMVEPQREMESFLAGVSKDFPRAEYVLAGAGRQEGELPQTIGSDSEASSFLPETNAELVASGRQRMTRIITIDSLMQDYPSFHPDLVKLDTQGFELEVLAGAATLFGRTRLFILETSLYEFERGMPQTIDCINYMAERGYKIYEFTEFHRRPLDGAIGCVDVAFVKTDDSLRSSHAWR